MNFQTYFINESIDDDLYHFRVKWKAEGVDLIIHVSGKDLVLARIIINKDKRGQGLGSQVIKELQSIAASMGMRILLTPDIIEGAGTTSVARLKRFYGSLGFVPNKGRNKDFSTSETMIWEPKYALQS